MLVRKGIFKHRKVASPQCPAPAFSDCFEAAASGCAVIGLGGLAVGTERVLRVRAPEDAAAGVPDIERHSRINEHLLAAEATTVLLVRGPWSVVRGHGLSNSFEDQLKVDS